MLSFASIKGMCRFDAKAIESMATTKIAMYITK